MVQRLSLRSLLLPAVMPLLLVVLFWPRLRAMTGGTIDQAWYGQHTARLLNDSLLRYYMLDGLAPEAAVLNSAGWADPLNAGTAPDRRAPRRAAGPLRGQFSVQLDDQSLLAPVARLEQSFTIEFLMRHHGQGFVTGGNATHSGSLISMGDGVYSGFVFALDFPSNVLWFQVGQPKPQPALATRSIQRIPQSVWTHVAGTWQDGELSLYVNGMLCGRTRSSLKYHEVARSSRLRAGYVGNGLGSARFDLQYLAVYRRAFSSAEVLAAVYGPESSQLTEFSELLKAGDLLTAGRPRRALDVISRHPRDAEPRILGSAIRYRRAECLRELGQHQQAEEAFGSLAWQDSPIAIGEQAASEQLALQAGVIQPSMAESDELPSAPRNTSTTTLTPVDVTRRFLRQLELRRVLVWKEQYCSQILPKLQSACSSCHTARQSFGLPLTILTDGDEAAFAGIDFWQSVSQKLDQRRHDPSHCELPEELCQSLQHWIAAAPVAGLGEQFSEDADGTRYFDLGWTAGSGNGRRLTRLELQHAVRDLLGIELTDDQLPPSDGSGGEGFDTNASTLITSGPWLNLWLRTLQKVSLQFVLQQLERSENDPSPALFDAERLQGAATVDQQLALIRPGLAQFLRQAWRRPPQSAEIEQILGYFRECRQSDSSLEDSLAQCLTRILLSPRFLLVLEPEPDQPGRYRLDDFQYATRLALFLWSSIPDHALLEAAAAGELRSRAGVLRQVRRMLADSRSLALGRSFAIQWLGLQQMEVQHPDQSLYPDFNPQISALMKEQAARTVWRVFSERRSLGELLASDAVLVNGRLAQWYGLPLPHDADWQPVRITADRGAGILALGAVHVLTSYPRRTSPVLRGRWLLETLLGETVEPPPPGVPTLRESSSQHGSLKEQMEQHREDPDCIGCHRLMDPLGFALENYDPVGRFRTMDGEFPVDASGELPDGTRVTGLPGLISVLQQSQRHQQFVRLFSRRMLGYALGRELDHFDDSVIDYCVERLGQSGDSAAVLLEEISVSAPFRSRYAVGDGRTLLKNSAL